MESSTVTPPTTTNPCRVLVFGATGSAGQATAHALIQAGYQVTCVTRVAAVAQSPHSDLPAIALSVDNENSFNKTRSELQGRSNTAQQKPGKTVMTDITDPESLKRDVFDVAHYDVIVSCMASRSGLSTDAWEIDHRAHVNILKLAKASGVKHMIYLSAICVQKPLLEFQHAKLAFEKELIESGLTYSIVRPTAFFKSLSGQIERVRNGKAFLLFGDGTLTACKPVSDNDLGKFIAGCIEDTSRHNQILPVGGPGAAITPREQGELIFSLLQKPPRFKKVPVALLSCIQWGLGVLGRINKTCANKAELASIGRYYATESMLVLNSETGHYDAELTPSTGTDTLRDFYASVLDGTTTVNLGQHAVFTDNKKS